MADASTPQNNDKSKVNFIALVVLLIFAALIVYMLTQLQSHETYWTRALYIFGGVEAIAFAAAGYLFGKEVSREQINKAEQQANDAKQDAQQAQQETNNAQREAATAETKAKDIVAAVKAQVTSGASVAQTYGSLGASQPQTEAVQAALRQLAQTVEGIYQA